MFNRELYNRIKEHEETIKRLRAELSASRVSSCFAWKQTNEITAERDKLKADNEALLKALELANGPRVIGVDHARSGDDETIITVWKPSQAKPAPSHWQRLKAALARLVDINIGIGFYPNSANAHRAQVEYNEAIARHNAGATSRKYADLMARTMARDADALHRQREDTKAAARECRDRGENYLK